MGQGQAEQTEVRVTRVDAVGLRANRRDPYRQLGRGPSSGGRQGPNFRDLAERTRCRSARPDKINSPVTERGAPGGAGAFADVGEPTVVGPVPEPWELYDVDPHRRARRGRSGARDELPARPVHGPGARASALRAVVRRASGRLRGVRRLCEHQSARYSGGRRSRRLASCVPLDSAFSKHEGPPCLVVFGSLGASCTTAVVSEMSRHHRPCPLSAEPRRRG